MKLTAYETVPATGFGLAPAPYGRQWMDETSQRSAYRCLPLLIANQAGWMITNPGTVRVKWDGGPALGAVQMQRWETPGTAAYQDYMWPSSHFGSGIITWTLPFLFRTPPGYNLLVRGPANCIKDGVAPLEGVTETDWATATFTMNWKVTRSDTWVTFEQGEPLCMIVPQRRGELEEFTPKIRPLSDDPDLCAGNKAWQESRDRFSRDRLTPGTEAAKHGWERTYFRGQTAGGELAPEHQTRLRLQPFS